MADAVLCPRCEKVVPADAPRGLCPACMMQAGLDSDASGPADEFATLPPRTPARPGEETVAPPFGGVETEPNSTDVSAAPADIPGYEILGELGRGGMGVVYKARQTKLNRIVALKMILAAGHAGSAELARFRTEAEAIARLQHPNIVQVHEIGEHEGKPYFSLEFCAGGSLAQKIDGTPLPPKDAAQLVETLARGMDAAHQKGVIHRDLKPANILLQISDCGLQIEKPDHKSEISNLQSAIPKVTDFGLAKKLDEASQTQSGAIMGTPSYMAPEQAGGKGKEVGPAADTYALGAILYELLTGRPPFKAATALDTVLQVVSDDPVPLRQLQSKTPRDLETICLKCLQKEPAKRYSSAQDLAEDLRRFQASEPILARPTSIVERTGKWVRRRPMVAGLLTTVFVVTILGIGAFVWAFDQTLDARDHAIDEQKKTADALKDTEKARKKALTEKEIADEARKQAEAATKEMKKQLLRAEWLVYAGKLTLAQREWEFNNVAVARSLLAESHADFRGWEYRYLQTLFDHVGQRTFKRLSDAPLTMALSADGKRIATGGDERTIRIWDSATGAETLPLQGHANTVTGVAISIDGKHIASASRDKLVILWDASTGKRIHTCAGHTDPVTSVAISRDGKRIVSGGFDRTAKVWDAATGQNILSVETHDPHVITCVAFSPDGARFVLGGYFGVLEVRDTATGKDRLILKGHKYDVTSVAFSPDGTRIVTGSVDSTAKVWDSATGRETITLRGHTGTIASVAFSSDGNRIVSGSSDNTVKVWNPVAGDCTLSLKGHTGKVTGVAFNPDATRIISGSFDRTIKFWDPSTGSDTLTMRGQHPSGVAGVAFSSDGQHVAGCGFERQLSVWNARTGQLSFSVKAHPSYVTSVAFSRDGKQIASAGGEYPEYGKVGRMNEVKLWDVATRASTKALKGHGDRITSVAFSPDGTRIVTGSWDQTVKVWDPATGQETLTLTGHKHWVNSVAFSSDGKRIASGSGDKTVKIWDTSTGKEIRTLDGHPNWVHCVAFSPDGPDGARIVSASGDQVNLGRPGPNEVKVFEVSTGQAILTLKGHAGPVTRVAFSPDGKRIITGSTDRTIKVWDAATGQDTLTLRGHGAQVSGLAFSGDGKRIVSGSEDMTLKVWDASLGE